MEKSIAKTIFLSYYIPFFSKKKEEWTGITQYYKIVVLYYTLHTRIFFALFSRKMAWKSC